MQKSFFIGDAITNRHSDPIHVLGYREDGMLYFNSALLTAAKDPGIPTMEKLNFATIVYRNIMEIVGRDLAAANKKKLSRIVTLLTAFAKEINGFVDSIDMAAFKQSATLIKPTKLFSSNDRLEYQYVADFTHFPTIISYDKKDLKNYWFDGIREIPIMFFRDYTYEYEINNLDLWCKDEMNEITHEMETRKIRIALAWVDSKLSIQELDKLRVVFRKIGIFPVFMNINLLNAMNSRGLQSDIQLNWPIRHPVNTKHDYFTPGSLPIYIRVPDESFDSIVDFYRQAANHPDVQAIYIAIYRAVLNGELIDALIQASKNGKDVRVYVESTARGDERSNLLIAEKLQAESDPNHMTVACSYNGLKAHAKMGMVQFKNGRVIVHMGTGNVNEATAKVYTDWHMISEDLEDVDQVSAAFTALGSNIPFRQTIRDLLVEEIRGQAALGINGRIVLKCNHTIDDDIQYELKMASQCGCTVKMYTRTTIGMTGGMVGADISSIAGRYLEHERIYAFGQGVDTHVYLSSSDLMFRNLYKRMEVIFKVKDQDLAWNIMNDLWFQ